MGAIFVNHVSEGVSVRILIIDMEQAGLAQYAGLVTGTILTCSR